MAADSGKMCVLLCRPEILKKILVVAAYLGNNNKATNRPTSSSPTWQLIIIMADHADDEDENDDGDIFVYRGGRAPQHVINVLIDESVAEIEDKAFSGCQNLLQVDSHDGLRKIGKRAFSWCVSLRRINLKSAVDIEEWAFYSCVNLADVEFGDRLETIGTGAFAYCSLQHLKLPSVTTIGYEAFFKCKHLAEIELSDRLESMGIGAFCRCERLQRIAIPLKRDLFEFSDIYHKYNQFDGCEQLTTVDLIGGIRKTVASLHMESWRVDTLAAINRINEVLPNTLADEKTDEIQRWMEVVMDKIDLYKAEHYRYVREGISLLELALWKAKLDETYDHPVEGHRKKAKVDTKAARKEKRITCGADIVIKNVFPFLKLE